MRTLILALVAGASLAAATTSALAQPVDELTVTGQWNGRGEPPASLSRVVDYGDLDLRNVADQTELRRRISATARDICDQLGQEQPNHLNLGHSCQERAVAGAMDQVRVAVAEAMNGEGPAYAVAAPPPEPYVAPSAEAYSANTAAVEPSVTMQTVTNGPVPDTPANRARFGQPMSHAGQRTAAAGN